mmetsp:Transcript_7427/g.13085  ORF Transcript_7427/g.13085 Transcript_7427/m.13085 type:complete len:142 (+) Transcript_7427:164-589(+)|eukprot:CAMPEP_0183707128 /NCGR_PEP_ID=MMETSP0737-20130205/3774_1 /TAXON_ID=385413 /ORGANISM="Thalassiosira miniscula, Strain CCMP1093" /LENGTH=141 /DNA_ID=CAMNT_0025934709 /DNA_START=146 /DNA_END=571 /DNA_ORIENTATION=+
MVTKSVFLALAIVTGTAQAAFLGPPGIPGVAWGAGTKLGFGFNGLGSEKADEPEGEPDKKISSGGLMQLITAGMGAPFLGDYQGVDDDGKMMFSLEANNLVDENGNSKQTQMPYFENGWVEEETESSESKSGGGFKFPWQK